MRLQLVVTLALVSSAFAQRNPNPAATNGNMPRPGASLTGGVRAFDPGWIAFPNPSALPPGAGSDLLYRRRFYAAFGAPYDAIYESEASFDAFYAPHPSFNDFDGFYSDLPPIPYQAQAEPPTPAIVINEGFRTEPIHPQFRDYSNVKLPEPGAVSPSTATAAPGQPGPAIADDQPLVFLIAFQDHVIHPAIAYWVQGDTLYYISLEGAPHQVSLTQVDRDFSKQLNRDRRVPFALPAVK